MSRNERQQQDKRAAIRKECEDIYYNRKNVIPKLHQRTIGNDGINLPTFIKQQYDYLYNEMIRYGEVYGAFYQIKDILEILLKLPTLIFVEGISKYVVSENADIYDEHEDSKKQLVIAKELLEKLLIKAPSLGDWEQLAKVLSDKKIEDIPVADETKPLYAKIHLAMKNIEKIFGNFAEVYIEKASSKESGKEKQQDDIRDNTKKLIMQFSAYRNVKIGHGATNLDIEKLFSDFKYFLGLLNSILDNSSYDGIEFIENGQELIVKDIEFSVSISMSPFVKEKNESSEENLTSVISMMESYFGKKKIAYLLNYNTGMIEENLDLYKTLQQVSTKLSIPFATSSGMKDDEISTENYESTFEVIPFAVDNEIFTTTVTNWIKESEKEDGKHKGILYLQAERGMGKSIFARMVTNDEELQIKKYNGNRLSLGKDFVVWSYFINDTFSSSVNWFRYQLFEFFGNYFRKNANLYRTTIKSKDPYDKARSDLESDVFAGKDTSDNWAVYFEALTDKIRNTEKKKLVVIIDGIDEIDVQNSSRLHFDKIFDANKLPSGMYVVFLGRLQSGVFEQVNGNLLDDLSLELQKKATENIVISRFDKSKENNKYVETLKRFVINNFIVKRNLPKSNAKKSKKAQNKNVVDINTLNETNISTEDILKVAEYRFVYITALLRIYLSNSTEFENYFINLKNNSKSFIDSYFNSLAFIGKKFREKLLNLLMILHLLKKQAVTREELSYLTFNHDIDNPDFQMNFLLQNVGMVSSKRSALGNTYLIEHEVWNKELESDFYKDKRLAVHNELRQRAESVARATVPLPHIRNWTVLICNFLNAELYRDESIVNNILKFISAAENDSNVYVQERIIKILKAISDKTDHFPKSLSLLVNNHLALAFFNCGHFHEGATLITNLENEIKNDDKVENQIKALIYFNLANYWERFEAIHNKEPHFSKISYTRALDYLEETNPKSFSNDFNRIICLLKLGEKEIIAGSLEAADSYLNKAEMLFHSLEDNKLQKLYIEVYLIILRSKIDASLNNNNDEIFIKKMHAFLDLKQDDYLYSHNNTTDFLFKPPNWNKKKLDFIVNQIIAEEYQRQGRFDEANKYIQQALCLASEMVYSSNMQGSYFENREIIPLKLLRLKNIIYAAKRNGGNIVSTQKIEELKKELNDDISREQEKSGEYGWLNKQIEELDSLNEFTIGEMTKDLQDITNNLVLADKHGLSSDARYKYYVKAAQIAAKSLNLGIEAIFKAYNDEEQRRNLQVNVQNYCFTNDTKQKILRLLIKACSKTASTAYLKGDSAPNSHEAIIKYTTIEVFLLETVLNNYPLLNPELWPSEYVIKSELADSYKYMAEYTHDFNLIDKAIDLLIATQNERDKEYFKLVERSKEVKEKRVSLGKKFFETSALFGQKGEPKNVTYRSKITMGPPSAVLADAYKTKADMMSDTDYIGNSAIINVLDSAIEQYLTITNTADTGSEKEQHWFDFDLADCYYFKGELLLEEGINAGSNTHDKSSEAFLDLGALKDAKSCLEKALGYLNNVCLNNQESDILDYYIKSCYIKLCYICTTKFKLEDNNNVAYEYFNKYLAVSKKAGKQNKYANAIIEEYENVIKALYFSLMDEEIRLIETIANEKIAETHQNLLKEIDNLEDKIKVKEKTKTEYQSKRFSKLRFGNKIENIDLEIKSLREKLSSIKQQFSEEKEKLANLISNDPRLMEEIHSKLKFVQEQAKNSNVNLYSIKQFYRNQLY